MENIQEDFVSFEVAKLLKEKGFDISGYLNEVWLGNRYKNKIPTPVMGIGTTSKLPTQALVIKWLRAKWGIHIHSEYMDDVLLFGYGICNIKTNTIEMEEWKYNSPEQALEAAILYTLNNLLIK